MNTKELLRQVIDNLINKDQSAAAAALSTVLDIKGQEVINPQPAPDKPTTPNE